MANDFYWTGRISKLDRWGSGRQPSQIQKPTGAICIYPENNPDKRSCKAVYSKPTQDVFLKVGRELWDKYYHAMPIMWAWLK